MAQPRPSAEPPAGCPQGVAQRLSASLGWRFDVALMLTLGLLPVVTGQCCYVSYVRSPHRRSWIPFVSELGCHQPEQRIFSIGSLSSVPLVLISAVRIRGTWPSKVSDSSTSRCALILACIAAGGFVSLSQHTCWYEDDTIATKHIIAFLCWTNAGTAWALLSTLQTHWVVVQTPDHPLRESGDDIARFVWLPLRHLLPAAQKLMSSLGLAGSIWSAVLVVRMLAVVCGIMSVTAAAVLLIVGLLTFDSVQKGSSLNDAGSSGAVDLPLWQLSALAEWGSFLIAELSLITFWVELRAHEMARVKDSR